MARHELGLFHARHVQASRIDASACPHCCVVKDDSNGKEFNCQDFYSIVLKGGPSSGVSACLPTEGPSTGKSCSFYEAPDKRTEEI